jgi:hypothetical protein
VEEDYTCNQSKWQDLMWRVNNVRHMSTQHPPCHLCPQE